MWIVILNGQIETFAIDDIDNQKVVTSTKYEYEYLYKFLCLVSVFSYFYSNNGWFSHFSNYSEIDFYFTSNNPINNFCNNFKLKLVSKKRRSTSNEISKEIL